MLSAQENERLTRVGPGTPMGELMRRYWHPVAAVAELDAHPVKAVKLLGESLVLYRDLQGRLGLIGDTCPHRRISLAYGITETEGLRCPYHGWMFDQTGQCVEMPAEPADSTFPCRVKIDGYPVEELGGLIFAYLGPEPVPLVPRWDLLVMDGIWRDIGVTEIPCNWLQCMENSLDPVHTEWLHGRYYDFVMGLRNQRDARGQRFVDRLHCTGQKIKIADIVDKYDALAPLTHSRAASGSRAAPLACLVDLRGCFESDQIHSEKHSWLGVYVFLYESVSDH